MKQAPLELFISRWNITCSYGLRRFDLTVLSFVEDSRAKNHPSKHTVLFPKTSLRNKKPCNHHKTQFSPESGNTEYHPNTLIEQIKDETAVKNQTEKRNLLN